jgi:uncharacterized protein
MTEAQEQIIESTVNFVQDELKNAEGGHDWWHIYRVWKLAMKIANLENADLFVVQLGALLHDIADSKFNEGDEEIGPQKAVQFMMRLNLTSNTIEHIEAIIRNISFHKTFEEKKFDSLELQVIQDADRLDAIGAIGIARAFNFGGHKNFKLYDPDIEPDLHMDKETYKKSDAPTINHFYEKLFLLKDMMNTQTGRRLAEKRHTFMKRFVDQFMNEWEGNL